MNLAFDPIFGLPVFLSLAVLILLVVAFSLWRRMRGSIVRGLAGALLIAALAGPSLVQDERQSLTDIAVLLVDHTGSQKMAGRMAQTDRAADALRQRIEALGNMEVRMALIENGPSLGQNGALPGQDGTRAFAVLGRTMGDIPQSRFAGAVMLTDGEVHDVPSPSSFATLQGPIHAIITGSRKESDRRMVIDHAPDFTLVGQQAKISFHVEDQGGSGADIPVTVSEAGSEPRQLVVQAGQAAQVDVDIPHAGKNYISLLAEVRPGELSVTNNAALAQIEGIRERLQVLLVSGQPNPGERTWRNLLKADTAVDLIHFTILRPPEKQDGTALNELSLIAFPTKELFADKLEKFDLVIFDRYQRETILPDEYLENVATYVKKGGALLIASGPDLAQDDGLASTPLGEILAAQPTGTVTEQPFKPLLTETGEKHPVTQNLKGASRTAPQWGQWFRMIDSTPATTDGSTEVLMQGPEGKPLLALRRVEQGRVAQILSDHGWLWARGYDGGGPEADMLKRIAHWLMKEPELEEERLAAHAASENIVIDRYGLGESYPDVQLQSPSGKQQKLNFTEVGPGHFQTTLKAEEAGFYTVTDGALEAVAMAGAADAREQSELLATDKKLRPVTDATGGGTFWLEDGLPSISPQKGSGPHAGSGWLNLHANGQTRTLAVHRLDLFSTLLALASLLIAASLMWWREGR